MHKSIMLLLLVTGAIAAWEARAQVPSSAPGARSSPTAADAPAVTRSVSTEAQYAELEAEMRALQERMAVVSREYAALGGAVPLSNAASLGDLLQTAGNADGAGEEIAATERRLRELQVELKLLKLRFSAQHPRVSLLERQIEALRARLAALRAAETAGRSPETDAVRESGRPALIDRSQEQASSAAAEAREEERRKRFEEALHAQRMIAADFEAAGRSAEAYDELPAGAREWLRELLGNTLRYSTTVWDSMQLITLTPQLGEYFGTESGILVLRAPADASLGLRDGDVILEIGGRAPTSPEHALRILSSFVPGETLTLGIMRNGRRETRAIVLPQGDSEETGTGAVLPPPVAGPPRAQTPQQR